MRKTETYRLAHVYVYTFARGTHIPTNFGSSLQLRISVTFHINLKRHSTVGWIKTWPLS